MMDVPRLIERHRASGLLIDTNLFVLYLVGKTNKKRIPNLKRTQTYTTGDFDLLDSLVSQFKVLITTPHVLTEVSNLAKLQGKERGIARAHLRDMAARMIEVYRKSRVLVRDLVFDRLGLTDAAIAAAAGDPLVLTDDLDLWVALTIRSLDVINFNHIRAL